MINTEATNLTLKNSRQIQIRQITSADADLLLQYLTELSTESKSRFGPHSFDENTINDICKNSSSDITYYVAVDPSENKIVSYMLIQSGMIPADEERYHIRGQQFEKKTIVTFAPSVADAWQSTGLGTAMTHYIENQLVNQQKKTVILWGGVQASNLKAVNFYKKLGYQYIASFWHNGKDNFDMIKTL